MTDFQTGILTLIRYALSPEETMPPLPDTFDYGAAYSFVEQQQLLPLIYYGASKTESFLNSPASFRYMTRACNYISHSTRQMEAFNTLTARLEAEGISYMPVKGILLKKLYPLPEMRVMGDCDLLIHGKQGRDCKRLMESLGYHLKAKVDHCNEYKDDSGLVMELHRQLVPKEERDLYAYYRDSWWTARPTDGHPCRYEMHHEDHFVYLFAHFVKHYRGFGAGIKFVVDFKVFEDAYPDMDKDYIRGELAKMGLDEFYDNVQRTIAVWFDGAPADQITDHLTDRLFNTAVFGSLENGSISEAYRKTKNASADGKEGNAKAALFSRRFHLFFLPYSDMKMKYPVLVGWPILLPLFWIIRGFDILFNHRDKIQQEKDMDNQLSGENIAAFRQEMNYVGLDKRPEKLRRPKPQKSRKK